MIFGFILPGGAQKKWPLRGVRKKSGYFRILSFTIFLPGEPFGRVSTFSEFRRHEIRIYFKLRRKGKGAGKAQPKQLSVNHTWLALDDRCGVIVLTIPGSRVKRPTSASWPDPFQLYNLEQIP